MHGLQSCSLRSSDSNPDSNLCPFPLFLLQLHLLQTMYAFAENPGCCAESADTYGFAAAAMGALWTGPCPSEPSAEAAPEKPLASA